MTVGTLDLGRIDATERHVDDGRDDRSDRH